MSIEIPAARPEIGAEERQAVERVMLSGMLAQGREVAAFESEFSSTLVEGKHSIAVNSGTSALHLSMLAAGIGPGDEVIVPSFSFAATANCVAITGATPVFADIEPEYFSLNPDSAEAAITPRTKAILPVHLYGHPANMVRFSELALKHSIQVFEDAAQAHGASLAGKPVGTWGLTASFSFYPTKNMTTGEGGMVTTADAEIARKVRLLRNQGQEKRYENEVVGLNNRMTDIHAAIGREQLKKLPEWNRKRRENAKFYDENLKNVVVPKKASSAVHVYHQYTIRIVGMNRDEFGSELAKRGIGNGVYYPIPINELAPYQTRQVLEETKRAASECLSLPIYPTLSESELEKVVSAVNEIAQAGA